MVPFNSARQAESNSAVVEGSALFKGTLALDSSLIENIDWLLARDDGPNVATTRLSTQPLGCALRGRGDLRTPCRFDGTMLMEEGHAGSVRHYTHTRSLWDS